MADLPEAGVVERAIITFVQSLSLADIPHPTRQSATRYIAETLLIGMAAGQEKGVGAIRDLALREHGPGVARIWYDGSMLSPGGAALVNAMAASALEYDSLNGTVHADAVILPAVLAVAQAEGRSGRELIEAYIVGVEVAARLSLASVPPQRGWTHTTVFGVLAAAASCARLLGLDNAGLSDAMGLALSMAAGTQQTNAERVLSKRLQPGLAARAGVFAAQAAASGIGGPRHFLTGKSGLWAMYQPGDADRLTHELGLRFLLDHTALKRYPVCACSHTAIKAALHLRREYGVEARTLRRVSVTITPFMYRLVGGVPAATDDPIVAAQFSIRYAIACALLRGRLSLDELGLDALNDQDLVRLARCIEVDVDEREQGEMGPATLRLELEDGRIVTHIERDLPGGPDAPLTDEEFRGKLSECALRVPALRRPDGLDTYLVQIENLAAMPDLRALDWLFGG